jgi:hypothetical protein
MLRNCLLNDLGQGKDDSRRNNFKIGFIDIFQVGQNNNNQNLYTNHFLFWELRSEKTSNLSK